MGQHWGWKEKNTTLNTAPVRMKNVLCRIGRGILGPISCGFSSIFPQFGSVVCFRACTVHSLFSLHAKNPAECIHPRSLRWGSVWFMRLFLGRDRRRNSFWVYFCGCCDKTVLITYDWSYDAWWMEWFSFEKQWQEYRFEVCSQNLKLTKTAAKLKNI